MKNNTQILHIEDDPFFAKTFRKELEKYGQNNVGYFSSCADALNSIFTADPELIFIDHLLENELGVNEIPKFKAKFKTSKIILLTSVNDFSLMENAFNNGVDRYLLKNEELNSQLKTLFT